MIRACLAICLCALVYCGLACRARADGNGGSNGSGNGSGNGNGNGSGGWGWSSGDDPRWKELEAKRAKKKTGARARTSETREKLPQYYLGAGILAHQPGRFSVTSTSNVSGTGILFPALSVQGHWLEDWLFGPDSLFISASLNLTPLAHSSFDGSSSSMLILPAGRLSKRLGPADLGLGLGWIFYRVSGAGGTTQEQNGGATQTYVLPGSTSTSAYAALNLGGGMQLDRLRLDVDFFLPGLLSSRAAVDFLAVISYGIF